MYVNASTFQKDYVSTYHIFYEWLWLHQSFQLPSIPSLDSCRLVSHHYPATTGTCLQHIAEESQRIGNHCLGYVSVGGLGFQAVSPGCTSLVWVDSSGPLVWGPLLGHGLWVRQVELSRTCEKLPCDPCSVWTSVFRGGSEGWTTLNLRGIALWSMFSVVLSVSRRFGRLNHLKLERNCPMIHVQSGSQCFE